MTNDQIMSKLNLLFWKIALALLVLLAAVSVAYNYIAQYVAEDYILEINQKL